VTTAGPLIVAIIATVAHLAVVQSLFGVGLLLLIGQRAFLVTRQRAYELGLTGLIVSFGVLPVGAA
jgi:hypothetical protein